MRRCLHLLTAAVGLLLAACQTPGDALLPEITFQHLPPIRIDVARIEVVEGVREPTSPPHVGHTFPTPPRAALRTWARDRLLAAGPSGTVRFVILDADVTETGLKLKKGLTGAFTDEQSHRYDAKVAARVEVTGVPDLRMAEARAAAERSQTIAESATVNERERLWFDMVDDLMGDFNTVMEGNIRKHLGRVLK